jgi:uncharacterized protein YjdB
MTMTTKQSRVLLVRLGLLAVTACNWSMGPSSCAASLTVAPPAATVQVGQTVQLFATVRDTAGNVLNGYTQTWTSDSPAVATVTQAGLVTGVAVGQTRIWASSGGQSGSAGITVIAASGSATTNVSP